MGDNLETTSQKDASEKLLLNEGDTETETKEETQDLNDDIITTSQTGIKDTLMEKETNDTVIDKETKDTVIEKEIDTVNKTEEETQDLKDDVDTKPQKEINDTVSEKEIDTVKETKEETQDLK